MTTDAGKHFNKQYFDRWYRDPRHRVFSAQERARRVAAAVAATELVLGRPLRSVLDVGCGEGHWRAPIHRLRPRARYTGVDPSPYVARRFGRTRNIKLGSIDTLSTLGLRGPFDLVLAVGFLNLLTPPQMRHALRELRPMVGGVALLELFTAADHLTGDASRYSQHGRERYLSMLRRSRLVPLGFHLYGAIDAISNLAELEHGR